MEGNDGVTGLEIGIWHLGVRRCDASIALV